jgi:dTDP-4-amino-4,6-dideoxygalactose transaminase
MKVSRYNYASQFADLMDSILADMRTMLLEGRYILSEEVTNFEAKFSAYIGTQFALGVNSGTDALRIALMSLGVGPGDEVITQANTFHATVAAIVLAGATPVLVDAVEDSFLMDVSQIERAITSRTRVLMPVHLYGKPTPMKEILVLARNHGLSVIEDAAQAHGARTCGRAVGSIGDIGCYSFHPSKNLAAVGDGGALCMNRASIFALAQECRALGQRGQNNHVRLGLNSKLDAIQALVLSTKLPYLDGWNEQRRKIAHMYRERLANLPLRFQVCSSDEEHVYHLFQVRTDRRDALYQYLAEREVDVVVRYPVPVHLQQAFSNRRWLRGQFPVAERLASELLCLPIRPDLSEPEIEYVVACVRSFFS